MYWQWFDLVDRRSFRVLSVVAFFLLVAFFVCSTRFMAKCGGTNDVYQLVERNVYGMISITN